MTKRGESLCHGQDEHAVDKNNRGSNHDSLMTTVMFTASQRMTDYMFDLTTESLFLMTMIVVVRYLLLRITCLYYLY